MDDTSLVGERGYLRKDTDCVVAPHERQRRMALAEAGHGVAFDELDRGVRK